MEIPMIDVRGAIGIAALAGCGGFLVALALWMAVSYTHLTLPTN